MFVDRGNDSGGSRIRAWGSFPAVGDECEADTSGGVGQEDGAADAVVPEAARGVLEGRVIGIAVGVPEAEACRPSPYRVMPDRCWGKVPGLGLFADDAYAV
jgi:hypothetical protein